MPLEAIALRNSRFHMPRNPHQGHVDEALERRTELAIKLAHDWMAAMNMSQRGLSRRLNVDQSVLSRFLSQQPGYEPAPKRPRILKLLEDIEQFCTQVEDVSLLQEDGIFDDENDLRVWARAHTLRLRHLRQLSVPGESLARVSELAAQALNFPSDYRAYTCINTLLAISIALFKEYDARTCSGPLIMSSIRRVDALEASARAGILEVDLDEAQTSEQTGRAIGFASVARAYAGLRLDDAVLLDKGAEGLLEAASYACPPAAKLWHNLLHFVDLALAANLPRATEWSRRAEALARVAEGSEGLALALADQSLEQVRAHWADLGGPDRGEA